MAIRTYQSFSGYVATEPRTDPTRDGLPRFYARAGQNQATREPDGSFTKLPTQYLPIVALGNAAEEAAALLRKGDNFTAEGRIRDVTYEKDGETIEGQEFEIFKVGRRPNLADRTTAPEQQVTVEAPAETVDRRREIPPEFTAPTASRAGTPAPAL